MAETTEFEIVAKETVTQRYRVLASDEGDARKRLHLHWKDPEMLREGIVRVHGDPEPGNREIGKDGITAAPVAGSRAKARTGDEPVG